MRVNFDWRAPYADGSCPTYYVKVEIQKADGTKCERCWNYSIRIGEFEKYPTVCERCIVALDELEKAVAA